LLSNLSEPANSVSPIRLDVSGSTSDPAAFGAEHARPVLDELRASTTAAPTTS
jgi:hypothetical protein